MLLACCFLIFRGRAAVRGRLGAARCHPPALGLAGGPRPLPPAASATPAGLGDVALAWQQAQGARRAPAAVVVLSLGLEAGGPGRMRFLWDEGALIGGAGSGMCTGPRGRMQSAGASTGCALCLRGGTLSAAPPRDARHSTHRGCTERHPRGLHVTAPTREAQNGTHAGCTSQARGRPHIPAPTRHPHGTHIAAPGRGARCRARDARGGTERRCWQRRAQRARRRSAASVRAPTPSSSSTRCRGGGGDT